MTVPLYVDLDGTLIKTDSLFESSLLLIKKNPLYVFLMIYWLSRSIACLKSNIANRIRLDPTTLPYSKIFLDYLKQEYVKGRKLVLITAADRKIATDISNHLGIFSHVLASDGHHNLKGENKRRLLCKLTGEKKFDYAGNDKHDLNVWSAARQAILVNAKSNIIKKATKLAIVEHIFHTDRRHVRSFFKAIRVHQYAKNMLIFLPLFISKLFFQWPCVTNALIAFVAFCLLASGVYLINDLIDLDADRNHRTKHKRPFAAGDLSIRFGIITSMTLIMVSFLLAWMLNHVFVLILISYLILSTSYSFFLKRKVILDVFVLAILYTIRIIAGVAAIQSLYSEWLITFSMFFFLSLAYVKRYSELYCLKKEKKFNIQSRNYHIDDLHQISLFGTVSGYLSTLVFALYINSNEISTMYKHPVYLWLDCLFLLYWISRIWMLTTRGLVHEDPVLFALKDRTSVICVIAIACIVLAASY